MIERFKMRKAGRYAMTIGSAVLLAIPALPLAAQIPATEPSVQEGATRLATTRISFNFKDASVDAVLDYLSETAGFIVVKEVTVSGRVTVLSKQPVTPEEAVTLLNTVLRVNGYTAIQMGRILKITTLDSAKKESIPVHFGSDPNEIPQTDELITQVIPVRSVDAVKLKTDLQPLIGSADFTANAGSNSIIMTDTSANIRRVVEIIYNLDKREASANAIKVRQLKYADATAAAKLVMDIFSPQQQQQQNTNIPGAFPFFGRFGGGGGGFGGFGGGGGGGGGRGGGGPGGGGPGGAAAQSDAGQTGHVIASADTRTNRVVVSGPPDTLAVVDDMLTQLDANPASEEPVVFIYKVNNGQAVDMETTLNSLFGGSSTNTNNNNNNNRGGLTLGSNYNSSNRSTSSGGLGGGLSSGGGLGGGSGGGGLGGGGGFGGGSGGFGGGTNNNSSQNRYSSNQTTQNRGQLTGTAAAIASNPGMADLIGQVYVVADADTNSLLVSAAPKYEQQVRDVIKELDRPVPQVLIKVLIAEVTHDNSQDMGVDFSGLNLGNGANLGSDGLISSGHGQAGSSILGAASAAASATTPPGMVINVLAKNVQATIQALAQANKLDVLSRPYVLTSDNQEADITVGDEVPIPTGSYTDANGGVHNTIQYEDIGIILSVTPHINQEGLVVMEVSPQISSLTGQTVQIQTGFSAPVYELRSADAYVAIRDGQTIVIGGLMQDQKTQNVSKVPLLGDLPLIGGLFQYSTTDKTKTELLIFLTPHVALQADSLTKMSQDEVRDLRLTPSAVEPGTMQDQMRGMARGSTTQPSTPLLIPATTRQSSGGGTSEPPLPGGS
jgi:general secretion pathway protein D